MPEIPPLTNYGAWDRIVLPKRTISGDEPAPAALKVLRKARLRLGNLLTEDGFEDMARTDDLIDSKNRYLSGFLATGGEEERMELLSSVEKRLIQAQRRVAELNASAEDAVHQGRDVADFRARTSRVQAYMSALKAIQRMFGAGRRIIARGRRGRGMSPNRN